MSYDMIGGIFLGAKPRFRRDPNAVQENRISSCPVVFVDFHSSQILWIRKSQSPKDQSPPQSTTIDGSFIFEKSPFSWRLPEFGRFASVSPCRTSGESLLPAGIRVERPRPGACVPWRQGGSMAKDLWMMRFTKPNHQKKCDTIVIYSL